MTLGPLVDLLYKMILLDKNNANLPVKMMIEFKDKGQREAPVKDVALAIGKYIVLIYEDTP